MLLFSVTCMLSGDVQIIAVSMSLCMSVYMPSGLSTRSISQELHVQTSICFPSMLPVTVAMFCLVMVY